MLNIVFRFAILYNINTTNAWVCTYFAKVCDPLWHFRRYAP